MNASNYITASFCFIADILGDFTMPILKTVSNLGIFLEKNLMWKQNYYYGGTLITAAVKQNV